MNIVIILSFVIWGAVAFRQFGQKLGLFFLMLIITDITCYIFQFIFRSNWIVLIYTAFITINILVFYPLIRTKQKRIKVIYFLLNIPVLIILYYGYKEGLFPAIMILLFSILLIKFILIFNKEIIINGQINVFYGVLVIYQVTLVVKFTYFWYLTETNILNMLILEVCEYILGLFFIIFKEDSRKLIFRMNKELDIAELPFSNSNNGNE